MTTTFWIFAGLMILLALLLVLRPLLRTMAPADGASADRARKLAALDHAHAAGVLDDAEYGRKRKTLLKDSAATNAAPRPLMLPVLLIALILPLGSVWLYRLIGDPRALDPSATAAAPHAGEGADAPDMNQAIAGLAQRLEENPSDIQGWMLLGRAYKSTDRFAEAKEALAKARAIAPDDADVMIEYAEALALASTERRIEGEARELLDRALVLNPKSDRGLWLLGISEAQAERYGNAVAAWEKLLPILPPDSDVAKSVRQQIAEARARAGMPAMEGIPETIPTAETSPALADASPAAAASGASLTLNIDIDPKLKAQVGPNDVLYVFARLPQGPKMPLAIQRIAGAKLPLTVTLDDTMGMMPTMKLSTAEQVVVGARFSKSGVANAQSGDLQALSAPITVKAQTTPIQLLIDEVLP